MAEIYDFYHFHQEGMLPLYVGQVLEGEHPERLFHDHDFSELVFVLSGGAEHLTGSRKCILNRGDILSLHPGAVHAYDKCSNLKIINVLYDTRTLAMPVLDAAHIPSFQRIFPLKEIIPEDKQNEPVATLPEELFSEVLEDVMLLKSIVEQRRPGCLFHGLAVFMQIVAKISQTAEWTAAGHRDFIQIDKAIAYMTEHCDGPVNLEQLIKKTNMSSRNFFRHFKNCTGNSPLEYLLQLRIRRSLELLRDTDMTVSEIAAQCGFSNGNYMCRIFRKRYGTTPGEFRKKLRNTGMSGESMLNFPKVIVKK